MRLNQNRGCLLFTFQNSLRLLFPIYRFFDRLGAYPIVFYSVNGSQERPFIKPISFRSINLLFNPDINRTHYIESCFRALCQDPDNHFLKESTIAEVRRELFLRREAGVGDEIKVYVRLLQLQEANQSEAEFFHFSFKMEKPE